MAEFLPNVATVLTLIVAVLAAAVAWWQIQIGRESQREATAIGMYRDYLGVCIQYPRLAGADPGVVVNGRGTAEYEQYEWFVASMLFACEQIRDLTRGEPTWKVAVRAQLGYHAEYLAGPDFVPDHYSSRLRHLLSEQARAAARVPGSPA